MTEKELKKLNRYQLLELLVMQTERADSLEKTVEELRSRLEERELKFSQMGSVAEASIYLSGVFDAAQKAADLYLENARKCAEETVEEARRRAEDILSQAEEQVRSRTAQPDGKQAAGKRKANGKGKTKNKRASQIRRAQR